ncbi:GNAT family N-acetyltransferase [Peptoanaerobacter stomatis]
MNIRFEKGINEENASILCEWSNKKGKAFQEQWMGQKISYPLNYDKIKELENIFSIFNYDEFIGMVQKIRIENDNIHIGRFLLEPSKTGMGFGEEALKKFVNSIFEDEDIKSITLTVFDFNQNAKNLYDKLGFRIDEAIEFPKLKYIMRKQR